MDVGFHNAGFQTLWANDINQDACKTYSANHNGIIECGSLTEYLIDLESYEGVDLLFGGPPCQGFSVAGKMDPNDPRSMLIHTFFEAVRIVRPKLFVCENVKALAKLSKWGRVRESLFKYASDLGYSSQLLLLNASDFGVPQSRERMFFIGARDISSLAGIERLIRKFQKNSPTVRKVLKKLGPAGSKNNMRVCKAKVTLAARPVLRRSPYAGMLFNGQGRPLNPDGYACTLPASMGGNRTPIIDEYHLFENRESWVEWYHSHLMNGGKPLSFEGAPDCLRRLTIDEAIRLQTFPINYSFVGGQSSIYSQIGNAVPCKLAEAVGSALSIILGQGIDSLNEEKEALLNESDNSASQLLLKV